MRLAKNVLVEQLRPNMKIVEFTKFIDPYSRMSEKVCKFLQLNLKGTTVEVIRNGKTVTCSINDLQPEDNLQRVFDIPDSLRRLTIVTKGLIPELKKRGFLGFTVQIAEKVPTTKQEKRQHSVRKANAFVQKVKENMQMREAASDAAKNMFDTVRRGNPNPDEIKGSINEVMSQSSPEALAAIASLQSSDQTYAHCVDAAAIFQSSYYAIKKKRGEKSIFPDKQLALFGAFMHDFGKAKVPKDILESTARFERDSREMKILQSHPVYGAELLSGMKMPSYIINIAHYHHVKMDASLNSNYPQGVKYEDVLMETRLAAIVDVYQALVGRRSYKKSWGSAAAIRYIDALAGTEFDPEVWEDFVNAIGLYPKGGLVEMSDDTLGFVMNVPEEDLERPEVAIFRDANGENYAQPFLVDLAEEEELEISQDLDHYEVLGEEAIDIFLSLQIH